MGSWVSWGFTRNIDIEMHKSKGEAIMTFQTWDSHCREPFSISGSSINLSYKYSWSKSALDTVRAFSLSLSAPSTSVCLHSIVLHSQSSSRNTLGPLGVPTSCAQRFSVQLHPSSLPSGVLGALVGPEAPRRAALCEAGSTRVVDTSKAGHRTRCAHRPEALRLIVVPLT